MQTVTTGAPSFVDLVHEYDTDEKCIGLLEMLRWRDGPRCPKCDSPKAWDIKGRKVYQCGDCDYQYSVTTGTVMHSTKLPLVKWVLAIALIANARKGVSSCQMARDLNIKQQTAWYLGMRIRRAMRETPWLNKFVGICELDETYLGGRHRGKPGRGSENKQPVFGIRERGGRVHAEMVPNVAGSTLKDIVDRCVDPRKASLMADEWRAYNQLAAEFTLERIDHSVEYVRGQVHTQGIESIWAILKRQFHGTHHRMSVAYLPLYLSEITFRFNDRMNPDLFLRILSNGLLTDKMVLSSQKNGTKPNGNGNGQPEFGG